MPALLDSFSEKVFCHSRMKSNVYAKIFVKNTPFGLLVFAYFENCTNKKHLGVMCVQS